MKPADSGGTGLKLGAGSLTRSSVVGRWLGSIWACVVLATLVRLPTLGSVSLWGDEGITTFVAQKPLSGLFEALQNIETSPALFFLLTKVWLMVGQSDYWARLLPCIFGLGGVAITYLLAKDVWRSRLGGAAAGYCAALSPLLVRYSQELRMYTLLYFLAVLGVWFLWRWSRSGNRAHLMAYGGAVVLGAYTHYTFFVYMGVFSLLALFVSFRERSLFKQWILVHVLMLLLSLPCLYQFSLTMQKVAGSFWVYPPTLRDIGYCVMNLGFRDFFDRLPFVVRLLFLAVQIALAVTGLILSIRHWIPLLVITYLPVLLMALFSVILVPILISRITIPSVIGVILMASGLIVWLYENREKAFLKTRMAVIVVCLFVVGSAWGVGDTLAAPDEDIYDYRGAIDYIEKNIKTTDHLLVAPNFATLVFYWYDQRYPEKELKMTGVSPDNVHMLPDLLNGEGEVWLLVNPRTMVYKDIYQLLDQSFPKDKQVRFGALQLWIKKSANDPKGEITAKQ